MFQRHAVFNSLFVALLFKLNGLAFAGSLLDQLAKDQRYSDISQISLAKLAEKDCRSKDCYALWLNNLARASILLGDYDSGAYYLGLTLGQQDKNQTSKELSKYLSILQNNYQPSEGSSGRFDVLFSLHGSSRNTSKQIAKVQEYLASRKSEPTYQTWYSQYSSSKRKSPIIAGIGSALLPGLGHSYLGMHQSAVMSFLLVAICTAATVDLYNKDQFAAATASGLIGSVFYTGSILSAIKNANDLNDRSYSTTRNAMLPHLLPEIRFQWATDL
jgi:hypothetical protein